MEAVMRSVIKQTILPQEWVIVSDGSTDRTETIVAGYARQFPWIRLVKLKARPARSWSAVVFAAEAGIRALETQNYSFIGLLDADVRLPDDYYEQILQRFAADRQLGMAGGLVVDMVGGRPVKMRQNLNAIAGAVQFFRRDCFESLGGLLPLPEGGWDALTSVRARMNGFKTLTFPELRVDHLKPRNVAEGNMVRRAWQLGQRDYAVGNDPVFEVLKCLAKCFDSPLLMGALARLSGYFVSGLQRRKRLVSSEIVNFLRAEQRARIRSRIQL